MPTVATLHPGWRASPSEAHRLQSQFLEQEKNKYMLGKFSDNLIHVEASFLKSTHELALEISDLQYKSENALKKYNQTKPAPSAESVRRLKSQYQDLELAVHPFFKDARTTKAEIDVLAGLKNWRPNATIFELNVSSRLDGSKAMKAVRKTFQRTIENKKAAKIALTKTEASKRSADYISYTPADYFSEKALKVDGNFENAAKSVSIDIVADDDKGIYKRQHAKKW